MDFIFLRERSGFDEKIELLIEGNNLLVEENNCLGK